MRGGRCDPAAPHDERGDPNEPYVLREVGVEYVGLPAEARGHLPVAPLHRLLFGGTSRLRRGFVAIVVTNGISLLHTK